MKRMIIAAVAVLFIGGTAVGDSEITYHLYLGGENRQADWDPLNWPAFGITNSSDADGQVYGGDEMITWDVRVFVTGQHSAAGTAYDGLAVNGAANLVFSLDLLAYTAEGACSGEPINLGASTVLFYSTMNDGSHPSLRPLQMAAFCVSFDADHPNEIEFWPPYYSDPGTEEGYPFGAGGVQSSRVLDPVTSGGPQMDRVEYPATSYHPEIAGDPPTFPSVVPGRLAGMGCGYSRFFFADGYVAGVGIHPYGPGPWCGRGLNASQGTPIAEGQINTGHLPVGTYALRLVPDVGNNVMRGDVACRDEFMPAGDFAVPANTVTVWNNTCPPDPQTGISAGYIFFEVQESSTSVTVQRWVSRRTHGFEESQQDLDIVLVHEDTDPPPYAVCGTSEPREGGVQTVMVTFDGSAGALVDGVITAVHLVGDTPGNVDSAFATLSPDGTEPTIRYSGLADVQCYMIDLAGELTAGIEGDSDCPFVNLYGDVDGDRNVTLTDILIAKNNNGQAPADHPRCDVDHDNNITLTDFLLAKDLNGNAVP